LRKNMELSRVRELKLIGGVIYVALVYYFFPNNLFLNLLTVPLVIFVGDALEAQWAKYVQDKKDHDKNDHRNA
jgi:hypothetical protein